MSLPESNPFPSFTQFIFSPLTILAKTLKTENQYIFDTEGFKKDAQIIKREGTSQIIKSILLTLAILIVIVPLLASANPFFNKLVSDILSLINFEKLLELILSADYLLWFSRIGFFFILTMFIPRMISYSNSNEPVVNIKNITQSIHLQIPKIAVAIVLFVFFTTQLQLHFASSETLESLGYTNSQYAREIFAQLTIVAIIILGLIYNDKNRSGASKNLTYLLIVQTIFLALIGLKSVIDYSTKWGLTQKRLWGYAGVIWIVLVLCFFAFKYYKDLKDVIFVKFVISLSAILLILVNIVNFDYIIYHYAKSRTGQGIDYTYLSELSSDSLSYSEQFQILEEKIKTTSTQNPEANQFSSAIRITVRNILLLQHKYKYLDFRNFNIGEYLQYQQIKSLDLSNYPSN